MNNTLTMMCRVIRKRFMSIFFKDSLIASDIIRILKSPASGSLLPRMNVQIGMEESRLRQPLKEYILREHNIREHNNPVDEIDAVISVNYWPQIYRLVFNHGRLVAVIVEIGINYCKFRKVYEKVESKIADLFAYSVACHLDDAEYTTYFWKFAEHSCAMCALNDRIQYVLPDLFDIHKLHFGEEINGTFVTKPGSDFGILPTLGVIFALDDHIRALSMRYTNVDMAMRRDVLAHHTSGDLYEDIFRGHI
jgi:hypothetical protein